MAIDNHKNSRGFLSLRPILHRKIGLKVRVLASLGRSVSIVVLERGLLLTGIHLLDAANAALKVKSCQTKLE